MSRKLLTLLSLLAVASLAAYGGWRLGRQQMPSASSAGGGERKVLFYQSPMHPWIKSDQPGNCTICGMKLVPIFEGDSVTRETGGTVIKLSPLSTRVANIETAEVRKQPLQRVIRVAGQIDDDDSAHRRLSAYVEGRIDKLFVNFVGAEITAGQPLASLYSRELLIARGEYVQALRQTGSAERETFLAASRQKLRRLGLTAEQIEKLPGQTGVGIAFALRGAGQPYPHVPEVGGEIRHHRQKETTAGREVDHPVDLRTVAHGLKEKLVGSPAQRCDVSHAQHRHHY